MARVYQTPGVYIEERSAFPSSAVPVATAVPAFIGYTERAERSKQSLLLKPTKISSFGEYLQFFGGAPTTKVELGDSPNPTIPYTVEIRESYFTLYAQMKMFFSNGGSDCYIVSVGGYTDDGGAVKLETLQKGIDPLLKEMEPTMVVIPEATTVKVDAGQETAMVTAMNSLYAAVLKHCGTDMRSRFAITDVWMNRAAYQDPDYNMQDDIDRYRGTIGSNNLQWGAAYFPYLNTLAVSADAVSLRNITNIGAVGDVREFPDGTFTEKGEIEKRDDFKTNFIDVPVTSLLSLLDRALNQDVYNGLAKPDFAKKVKEELFKELPSMVADEEKLKTANQGLVAVSPMFKSVLRDIRRELNLLPPSAAMAGIYSMVDNTVGVHQSPANVSVGSVIDPAVTISSDQQEDLNIPINGKAVNAIRSFPGKGTLVWGARTLDGNSMDWRYISVRRTVIFVEQSIKYAAEPYVFEPNTSSTWVNLKAVVVNFLTNVWQSGALAGSTAADAFQVNIGLGVTMTPVDILDGYLRMSVKLAVTRPAEFIVITFEQKMQQS
ncbi:hypothetical protein CLV84_1040 [Neolewinella xylanilytica]|uniref:Tail sheath protein C-terminal domain-containing protein n=1 Tax=Neolewinella xylanilytica TaxID=1514080 RepID=A0A2S6I997_9BACT|nr:phage tail sheath C-terminal domain-containing protein [Neolewinella xylanilytica]PPK88077.1 hypothetical protein CLV84_1040 [Neolewinella xylanilytica]